MLLPGRKAVKDKDAAGRVGSVTGRKGVDDDLPSGQPGLREVVKPADELGPSQGGGTLEASL